VNWAPGPFSQHFIFFVSYESAQKSKCYMTRLERLVMCKHFSLLGPFVSCEERAPGAVFTTLHFLHNL